MQRTEDDAPLRGGSLLPLLLALIVLSAVIGVLSFLTLGFVGVVLGLALLLAAFIALQYLIWGWWLGPWIARRESSRFDSDAADGDQK